MEKREKRKRRNFTAEYKHRAVDLVLKQGLTVAQAARDLGIYELSLGKWIKQAQVDQGRGRLELTTEERQELAQLRKKNRILREE